MGPAGSAEVEIRGLAPAANGSAGILSRITPDLFGADMPTPLLTLAPLFLLVQGIPADSVEPRLARLADSIVTARQGLPGIAIVVESGRLGRTWSAAAGRADTSRNLPLRPDQPFRVASNTKTYTAAAILRLAERGALALSDPIGRHLPAELASLLERDGYRTDRITIEQVLAHRAGLAEHPEVPSYVASVRQSPAKRWTRREQVEWLVDSLAPVGAPGERFKYSDTGYILLGAIVERHTGKNLGAAVRELVGLDRLGLRRTWWETLEPAPAGVPERVHQYIGGFDSFAMDPSFDLYGGGGIVAPLEELGRFLAALFEGKVFDRRSTLDDMIRARSPEFGGYGLGILGTNQGGRVGYGHSGFWGTVAYHFPGERLTVAVAVNEQTHGAAIFGTVAAVMRALFPAPAGAGGD
jgi:D-alanyl-D-alanine carboxypeptidase